jgi:phosphoribosylaminoimidazole (AIR) synthetase
MGVGMIVVVRAEREAEAMEKLERCGERAFGIGEIAPGERGVRLIPEGETERA